MNALIKCLVFVLHRVDTASFLTRSPKFWKMCDSDMSTRPCIFCAPVKSGNASLRPLIRVRDTSRTDDFTSRDSRGASIPSADLVDVLSTSVRRLIAFKMDNCGKIGDFFDHFKEREIVPSAYLLLERTERKRNSCGNYIFDSSAI